jgi:hypothetical protein
MKNNPGKMKKALRKIERARTNNGGEIPIDPKLNSALSYLNRQNAANPGSVSKTAKRMKNRASLPVIAEHGAGHNRSIRAEISENRKAEIRARRQAEREKQDAASESARIMAPGDDGAMVEIGRVTDMRTTPRVITGDPKLDAMIKEGMTEGRLVVTTTEGKSDD